MSYTHPTEVIEIIKRVTSKLCRVILEGSSCAPREKNTLPSCLIELFYFSLIMDTVGIAIADLYEMIRY